MKCDKSGTCRWAKKNLSPYAMAEWSTKALASKAFLVNHAEFEALVSLRKDNFHKIWWRGNVVTLLAVPHPLTFILSESYKEWATHIKHQVQALIWKLEGNVNPLDLRYKIDFSTFSSFMQVFHGRHINSYLFVAFPPPPFILGFCLGLGRSYQCQFLWREINWPPLV